MPDNSKRALFKGADLKSRTDTINSLKGNQNVSKTSTNCEGQANIIEFYSTLGFKVCQPCLGSFLTDFFLLKII